MRLTAIELCAGGGGQARGLQQAGFEHLALIDNDEFACATLKRNFKGARVIRADIRRLARPERFAGVDLLAAGLPCPPFSAAGKRLGPEDERNLFPAAFDIIRAAKPKAIMIENVAGLLSSRFKHYRQHITSEFQKLGYGVRYQLFDAADFGVPQRRRRVVIVALLPNIMPYFSWPRPPNLRRLTVGEALLDLMNENGWWGAQHWAEFADKVAPTIVGGSKKHGGPDLGPRGARRAWAELGVEGKSIADAAPSRNFEGAPRLTIKMVATLQGFSRDHVFVGKKTHAYRQVGNAFPPPVARAVATQIKLSMLAAHRYRSTGLLQPTV